MERIDAHAHFWDPARLHYAWLQDTPPIQGPHLPHHYHEAAAQAEADISGLVFVEADCDPTLALDEVSWIASLAQQDPRILGIVAAAPLEKDVSIVATHLNSLKACPLVRGVRRLIQNEPAGFCTQPPFLHAVRQLPEFGFTFDLCLKHPQLPEVIALVEACPDTTFILDHLAKPDIAQGQLDPWRRQIDRLAGLPQVAGCKLSGLITEARWDSWTLEDLRPYVQHAIQAFGPERLLFGSDWPVSVLAGGYSRWWEAVNSLTDHLSSEDRAALFAGTARRLYRLP